MHERISFNVYRHLENILDVLAKYHAPATFFITGALAEKHPRIPQRICRYDHEVASHGHSHTSLSDVSFAEAEKEIGESTKILGRFQEVKGFRAPFLVRNKATYLACEKLGLIYDSSEHGLTRYRPNGAKVTVLPVVFPLDTHGLDIMRLTSQALVKRWLAQCVQADGATICMHAWRMGRKKYVRAILEPLLRSDLHFVKACDLTRQEGVALTFDVEYTSLGESVPHNVTLLKSPAWKHPKGLIAREFFRDQS